MFAITSFYAGLLVLVYLYLTVQVIRYRRANQVSLGDKGDGRLLQLIRAHSNCAENAPLGIVVLALIEGQGAPGLAVHVLGLLLLVGRVLHGAAFVSDPMVMRFRVLGMGMTLAMLGLSGIGLVLHALL